MQVVKYNYKELFLKLIILFPIATLFQYHVSIFNKALFTISIIVLVFVVLGENKVKLKNFAYIVCVTLYWIFIMLSTPKEAFGVNINMSYYYIFLIYYIVLFMSDKASIWRIMKKNHAYIYGVVLVYSIVIMISMAMPSSYINIKSGGWGNGIYFASLSGSPNRVGPASLFIVIMIIFLIVEGYSKKILILVLPQLYVFLMGGSRTYFVLGVMSILILVYVVVDNKKMFYLSLIPIAMVGIVLVWNSAMMDKFIATIQENVDSVVFWQKLTNTRSIFWVEQLELFKETSLLKQIFGNGINFTSYNYGLWAHNDFIEILCSYGYIGLLNYIVLMWQCFKKLVSTKKGYTVLKMMVFSIWLFNAVVNFYYCYFCAMLSYPLLLVIINYYIEIYEERKCN